MDNFVKIFKTVLKRTMVVMVLLVAISASVSAQYVAREIAIARIEAKVTQVQQAISTLPTNSLDYRYGQVQLFTYKAIFSEIVGNNLSVEDAVNKVFAIYDSRIDSIGDYLAILGELYKKNNPGSGTVGISAAGDPNEVIKKDVKQLLK